MKWKRVAGSGGNTWSGGGYVTAVFETPDGQRGVGGVHYTREIIPGNPWPGKDIAVPFGPIRQTASVDSPVIDAEPEFVG